MNKQPIFLFLLCLFCLQQAQATDYEIASPNGQLKMKLHIDNGVTYEIWHGNIQLIAPSPIGLTLNDGTIIGSGTIKGTQTNSINDQLQVPVGKNKTLNENYNELIVQFNENYDLVARAYNEGLAYRFITRLPGNITINNEDQTMMVKTIIPITWFTNGKILLPKHPEPVRFGGG